VGAGAEGGEETGPLIAGCEVVIRGDGPRHSLIPWSGERDRAAGKEIAAVRTLLSARDVLFSAAGALLRGGSRVDFVGRSLLMPVSLFCSARRRRRMSVTWRCAAAT
jgi:hypothetical protein